jgi:hypothetical protein
MEKYRSHKIVEAGRVIAVSAGSIDHTSVIHVEGDNATYTISNGRLPTPTADVIGGYLVRYEDGFTSWSPAKAFEAGYTKLTGPLMGAHFSVSTATVGLPEGDALEAAIAAKPGAKVSKADIENRIMDVAFYALPSSTVTICSITLDNGFSVRGESACVDPTNFDRDIGERIAYDNAFDKFWPLFGFLLAEKRFTDAKFANATGWTVGNIVEPGEGETFRAIEINHIRDSGGHFAKIQINASLGETDADLHAMARIVCAALNKGAALPFDLAAHLRRQIAWSLETFGPGERDVGIINHIRKELDEALSDHTEFRDVIILGFDALLRRGHSPEEIIGMIVDKQTINEGRNWPDWRQFTNGEAIEHIRD